MARLSVNINDETVKALRDLQDERGMTATELVRRAIAVYAYLDRETRGEHKTLQLRDSQKGEITNIWMR